MLSVEVSWSDSKVNIWKFLETLIYKLWVVEHVFSAMSTYNEVGTSKPFAISLISQSQFIFESICFSSMNNLYNRLRGVYGFPIHLISSSSSSEVGHGRSAHLLMKIHGPHRTTAATCNLIIMCRSTFVLFLCKTLFTILVNIISL